MPTRLEVTGEQPRSSANEVAYIDPAGNPILLLSQRRKSEPILAPNWTWKDERPDGDVYMNHAQIFRDAFGTNSTDQDTRDKLDIEKGAEHALGMERAWLFGEKKIVQLGENQGARRYTGGILNWGAEIQGMVGGEPAQAEIEMWAEQSIGRVVITGAWMRTYVDTAAGKGLHSVPIEQSYGIPTVQWLMARGTVSFIKHRLLTGPTQWVAFYPAHLSYRWFRDTTFYERSWESQHAGTDAAIPPEPEGWMLHEYITEAGLEVAEPGNVHVLKK